MKKVLSLTMCAVLIFSIMFTMTGCLEKLRFIGKWEGEIDITDYFNDKISSEAKDMGEYLQADDLVIPITITFNSDGTYSKEIDEDAVTDAFEDLKKDLLEGMKKYLEDYLKKSGISMSLDVLLQSSNLNLEDSLDQFINEDTIDELTDNMNIKGNFEVKDGKLYLSNGVDNGVDEDVYETFEFDGDELILKNSYGAEDDQEEFIDAVYPITLKKVK